MYERSMHDKFTEAFLSKVTEFEFVNMRDFERNGLIDGYETCYFCV